MRNQTIFNISKGQLSVLWSWIRIARNLLLVPLLSLSVVFLAGCNDDDDDDFSSSGNTLSISDIQGFWLAESATFSGPEFIDLYEEPGSITLSIQSNGRFTFMINRPGEPDEVYTGKLGFDGDFLAVRFDGEDEDDSFLDFYRICLATIALVILKVGDSCTINLALSSIVCQ